MTSARRAKERLHRRFLAAGIGTSVAVHGAILGLSTFSVPASTAGVADRDRNRTVDRAEAPVMEVVALAQVPAATPAPPARSPSAAAAPSRAAGARSPAAAPHPVAEAAPSAAEMLAALETRARPSMKPNFAALQSVSPGGLSALPAVAGDGDDHDNGEDDGNSWWRRLGISVGSGGGHCKPKPGVIVSRPHEPVTSR